MDKIEALGSTIAQISLYDIKSYYNQAKAVVLNYTEMEAKVRDATNDDPWGASSTLMQEIAQGQQFNEIMPTIYKRFTEKEAREWRQIYKALQLLEYLIKHGSERVIDDARSHISMIKILKNFHYVDDKGKDQGINVRNRAKEIAELLSDVDRVRQERRKAKAARNKYIGVGSDGPSFTSSGGSKYGGFGSDSLGFSGGTGEDWNGGGASTSSSRDPYASRSSFKQTDDFEEYDAGEWEDRPATRATTRASVSTRRASISSAGATSISVSMKKPAEKATAPPPKTKEVDLFSMGDDDDFTSPTAPRPAGASNVQKASLSLDDEFDDFQSAPPASSSMATSSGPISAASPMAAKPNVFALLNANTPSTASPVTANGSAGMYGGSNMSSLLNTSTSNSSNMFGSSMMQPMVMNNNPMNHGHGILAGQYNGTAMSSSTTPNSAVQNQAAAKSSKPAGGDQFDDLFSFAGLTKSSGTSTNSSSTNGKPAQAKLSMAAIAREQSSASIWGGGSSMATAAKPAGMGTPMGSAAPSTATGSTSMQNNDDLLL